MFLSSSLSFFVLAAMRALDWATRIPDVTRRKCAGNNKAEIAIAETGNCAFYTSEEISLYTKCLSRVLHFTHSYLLTPTKSLSFTLQNKLDCQIITTPRTCI
jgi:hypothetical protein